MSKRILDRRRFLKTAGTAAAVVLTSGGLTSIVAVDRSWAMELGTLGESEARSLLKMTRLLYPHDALGDIYYAQVVEALDAKAKEDASLVQQVKEGVGQLDAATGVPWLALSDGAQLEVLKGLETSTFFQTVRGHTVVALYNNQLVWPAFGYQGSSADQGGYLFRGFQDLGWTIEPDAEASPAPYLG